MNAPRPPQLIVLFDGVCNLCDATVRFFKSRDPSGRFHFISQQSDEGRRIAAQYGMNISRNETIFVIEGDRLLARSDAALAMIKRLPWPWRGLKGFALLPRPMRDAAYDLVAKNRYRIFGHSDVCQL